MHPKPKEAYFYITGQKISKKQWNDLIKRYGLIGNKVIDGKTTIAYRIVFPVTERQVVISEGRY